MDMQELVSAVFGPLGGVTVVLGGLAGWLGAVLQARLNKATDTSAAIDIVLRHNPCRSTHLQWRSGDSTHG